MTLDSAPAPGRRVAILWASPQEGLCPL